MNALVWIRSQTLPLVDLVLGLSGIFVYIYLLIYILFINIYIYIYI